MRNPNFARALTPAQNSGPPFHKILDPPLLQSCLQSISGTLPRLPAAKQKEGAYCYQKWRRNGLRIRPEDLSIKSQQRIVNSSKTCCLLSPLCCRQHPCSWPFGGGTSKINVLDIVWLKNHTNRILEFCIRGSYSGIDNVVVQESFWALYKSH